MASPPSAFGALRCLLLAVALPACAIAAGAGADDLKEAQKLYGQGKLEAALEKADLVLQADPRDAQARFLKGLVLADEKRTAEAIQAFTGLTEDFPEMPEPYNNLAVLYAAQGQHERARAVLEVAIATHPGYAIAHENLGDIHAQLARQAYERAAQLDKTNTTATLKMAKVLEALRVR